MYVCMFLLRSLKHKNTFVNDKCMKIFYVSFHICLCIHSYNFHDDDDTRFLNRTIFLYRGDPHDLRV